MNLLGIDYGHRRIGLSCGDDSLCVAVSIPAAVERDFDARMSHIELEINRRRIDKLVVGYPLNMDGTVGDKALEVDEFIAKLQSRFGLPVARVDERLSSYQAEQDVMSFSKKGKKSVAARQKYRRSGDIDSRASALFLQEYLDTKNEL